MAASGELTLCYDARILAEYREVLLRPKFGLDAHAVEDFLTQVEAEGEPAAAPPLPHRLPDPSMSRSSRSPSALAPNAW